MKGSVRIHVHIATMMHYLTSLSLSTNAIHSPDFYSHTTHSSYSTTKHMYVKGPAQVKVVVWVSSVAAQWQLSVCCAGSRPPSAQVGPSAAPSARPGLPRRGSPGDDHHCPAGGRASGTNEGVWSVGGGAPVLPGYRLQPGETGSLCH